MKSAPTYAIASVDHALRIATMLQLEGSLTVAQTAERCGIARSTAHRLLQMLVYRDFAIQDEARTYHVGPVLELARHSRSATAQLRQAAVPHLRRLVSMLGESANVAIRTGSNVRFIASVESDQALRVTSREGMVFPAEQTTTGLLLLAELTGEDLTTLYTEATDHTGEDRPIRLSADLARVRRQGFAVNRGRSERGVVAVGVPIRARDGAALAGLSISMPSVRYPKERLPIIVNTLNDIAAAIREDLPLG